MIYLLTRHIEDLVSDGSYPEVVGYTNSKAEADEWAKKEGQTYTPVIRRYDIEGLEECPFCASQAEIKVMKGRFDIAPKYMVKCTGCGVQTETSEIKKLVIDKWNGRK